MTAVPDLNELRHRILNGGQYTNEELRAAITALRTNRIAPVEKSTAKRAAKTASAPMSDEALNESLRSLGLDI